ncbi:galactose-3-O-sulfotransferase 2-like [Mercenaria mercenaria]|uniref:galactose-3-O-sulfotransferase 2-like n=1 Tax=Mercenaria mercenaria TaxID=6596 RepID=UPI00234EC5A9|nr:galactose-3-O-sulfotransferase 2-like [Mercenaria mercenaria]
MIGKPTIHGVSIRLAASILLALVFMTIVLQTYFPLDISTSISSPHQFSSRYTSRPSKYSTSFVAENALIQNDSLLINTASAKNINMPEHNMSSVQLTIPKRITNASQQTITHIGFLKVHKAGSETMQNIFFRFGLKHNLTFVLPEKGRYFRRTGSAMPVRPGNHHDILAVHSVYSRKLFRSVLPIDSVNIGIIREPLERMVSAAYYYRDVMKRRDLLKVPKLNFIHNIVNQPHLYDRKPFSRTKNSMGQDFGFSSTITINDTEEIEKQLDLLKKDFKLVLVLERFEESLILMKRTLNWDLEDVIYLKRNSHAHKPVVLSPNELNKFKSTCFLDYVVYETFYEIFDKKIAAEGPDFVSEVEHFKSVLHLVKDYCEQISKNLSHKSLRIAQSAWNEPFEISNQDCRFLQMNDFIDFIKRRHRELNGISSLRKKRGVQ